MLQSIISWQDFTSKLTTLQHNEKYLQHNDMYVNNSSFVNHVTQKS